MDEINKVADAWIAAQSFDGNSWESPGWWAVEKTYEWERKDPESLWKFIKVVNSRENIPKVVASFAAGPVEQLVAAHGEAFIDRIVEYARKDPKFNYVLGGVWKHSTEDTVWEKILQIRNHVW